MDQRALKELVYHKYGLNFQTDVNHPQDLQLLMIDEKTPFAILSNSRSLLDVKCPKFASLIQNLPAFQSPQLVSDDQEWVETDFRQINDHDLENVLDYAFKATANGNHSFVAQQLIYLPGDDTETNYHSQKIPINRQQQQSKRHSVPDPLQKMMESYDYTILPVDEQLSLIHI